MAHLIRGFEVDEILRVVGQTEKLLGVPNTSDAVVYRRIGYWLVQESYLRSCFISRWRGRADVVVPYLLVKPWTKVVSKFIRNYSFFTKFPARLAAQAVCVRNNIRSFYVSYPRPFTAKILLSQTRTLANLKTDVAVRTRLSVYQTVNIPATLQYNLESDPPYLCEEIIFGRRLYPKTDASVIVNTVCSQLWQTYVKHGIDFKRIKELIDTSRSQEILERVCAVHAWEPNWADRRTFISKTIKLLETDGLLPCSLGHGDLGFSNLLLRADGQVFVLDWERARERPLVSDLMRIIIAVPSAREFLQSKMATLVVEKREKRVLPFPIQYFVAIIEHVLLWGRAQTALEDEEEPKNRLHKYLACANSLLSEIRVSN